MKRIKIVASSKRPKIIPSIKNHFAPSGSGAKVPEGPMIGPKPGPIFERLETAADRLVIKSRSNKERVSVRMRAVVP